MSEELPEDAVCIKCGYSLRGLAEHRCPECGSEFDPLDPSTFVRRRDVWWRGWAHPPGNLTVIGTLVLGSIAFLDGSLPGPLFPFIACFYVFIASFFLLFCVVDYLVRVVAVLYNRRAGAEAPNGSVRRGRWRWGVLPLSICLIVSVYVYPWPTFIRFKLSQSAFEEAAKACLRDAANTGPSGEKRESKVLGLYYVQRVTSRDPGFVFFRVSHEWLAEYGFVYRHDDAARTPGMLSLKQCLAPRWYIGRAYD
ncbi:MAG: hypothetical protein JXQ75_05830 [Phycisphaerae bacterium]|nr:hypothetical protein [Phycisphaerae bacterium]